MSTMCRFYLERLEDPSGVSGTGIVAEGMLSSTGKVVLFWLTSFRSIATYDCLADVLQLHGHNGKTVIRWIDSPPLNAERQAPQFSIRQLAVLAKSGLGRLMVRKESTGEVVEAPMDIVAPAAAPEAAPAPEEAPPLAGSAEAPPPAEALEPPKKKRVFMGMEAE